MLDPNAPKAAPPHRWVWQKRAVRAQRERDRSNWRENDDFLAGVSFCPPTCMSLIDTEEMTGLMRRSSACWDAADAPCEEQLTLWRPSGQIARDASDHDPAAERERFYFAAGGVLLSQWTTYHGDGGV